MAIWHPSEMWTYDDYLTAVAVRGRNHPHERSGQVHFKALLLIRPELAGQIVGTSCDPSYSDSNLPAFREKVRAIWTRELHPAEILTEKRDVEPD